jgi:hypothetical protein
MERPEPFVTGRPSGAASDTRTGVLLFAGLLTASLPFMVVAAVDGEVTPGVAIAGTVVVLAVIYGALRAFGWLRAYDHWELRVDESGLAVTNRRGTKRFAWPELLDVAFTNKVPTPGGRPALVIESSRYCDPKPGARARAAWGFMGRLPHATVVPMKGSPPGTVQAIEHALRQHSGGRLPGPFRREISHGPHYAS